jgi:hypothetical protein
MGAWVSEMGEWGEWANESARRARSTREFAAKLQIVNEDVDEVVLWLEFVATLRSAIALGSCLQEARELRAIFAKARLTTRRRVDR